jgi:hypothetical protein
MPFLYETRFTDPPAPRQGEEILCIARITFWGHEVGTGRETHFTGQVSVNFADLLVKSEKN